MKIKKELLEQYDFVFGDYMNKIAPKYEARIGRFILRFSALEHSLDIATAECISDRMHSTGYMVLEGLTLSKKIDLYRKLSQEHIKHVRPQKLKTLASLIQQLRDALMFRNYIAHANWSSLERTGYVRTKVVEKDGDIVFKKVRITPAKIDAWIRRIERLEEQLSTFSENQFA